MSHNLNVYRDELMELTLLYSKTKYVMLRIEDFFDETKMHLQPRMEIASAFDHLMYFLYSVESSSSDAEKLEAILYDTYKHVHRAFFDFCDWATILFKEALAKELSGYTRETIASAIPSYYTEIRPDYDKLTKQIAEIRGTKTKVKDADIDSYVAVIDALFEHCATVRNAQVKLLEASKLIVNEPNKPEFD